MGSCYFGADTCGNTTQTLAEHASNCIGSEVAVYGISFYLQSFTSFDLLNVVNVTLDAGYSGESGFVYVRVCLMM